MATYALGLVPLIDVFLNIENKCKMIAFADDLTGAGNLEQLHMCWMKLIDIRPKYGYFPKPEKSYLIVKESKFELAKNMFSGTCLKVISAGTRHLGAVIGSNDYKNEYVNNLVTTDRWLWSCGRAVKALFSWAKSSEFEPCLDISVEVTSQC